MVFEIDPVPDYPRNLSQAVLQITSLQNMYQAELASVPGIKCGDKGQLSSGRQCLQPGTDAWLCAELFVRLYPLLYRRNRGDGVAMRNWLRVEDEVLEGIPHRLLVDENCLGDLLVSLERTGG